MEWAQSDDDGADDEATLDAEEQAAAAEGVDVKVCHAPTTRALPIPFQCSDWYRSMRPPPLAAYAHHCIGTQEEHAAETSALAAEADMPLDQLLAAYGYRIGPDGGRERVPDGTDASQDPANRVYSARECSAEQVQIKTEQRQSPRTRQQTKPEMKSEAAVAVKSQPGAVASRQLDMQAPPSLADHEVGCFSALCHATAAYYLSRVAFGTS